MTDSDPIDPQALAAAVVADTSPVSQNGPNLEQGENARPGWLIDQHHLEQVRDRPAWHGIGTPPAVVDAWREVEGAVDLLEAAIGDHGDLWGAEERDKAAYAAKVEAAVRAGKDAPKAPALVDYQAQRRRLHAEATALLRLAREKRAAYDRAVADAAEEWWSSLLPVHETGFDAARVAWGEARTAIGRYMATSEALRHLARVIDPGWADTLPRAEAERMPGPGAGNELDAYFGSGDPRVTGAYLREPPRANPPLWFRRRLWNGSVKQQRDLAAIEYREDYQFSAFTRDHLAELGMEIA